MSFAATYLREQADRRGCTVHELRRTYELSVDRLRARG
jgi:hypothetical protein